MSVATKPKPVSAKPCEKRLRHQAEATVPPVREEKSGDELRALRNAAGLNRPMFAQLAHFSERTLATYEKARRVPAQARPQLTEAERLVEALRELLPDTPLSEWLRKPNPGFGGRAPLALIRAGQRDLLWEMVHQTRQGAFA